MSDLRILYEDNHILAVYKEPGILSQADNTGEADLLANAKIYLKNKYNKPGEVYLGLVHRLDRNTDGIMVFARTSKAAARLSDQIRSRSFRKIYKALAEGELKPAEGEMRDFLIKDEKQRKAAVAATGSGRWKDSSPKEAVLVYKTLRFFETLSSFRSQAECSGYGIADYPRIFLTEKDAIDRFRGISEVEIELLTGRFHQIRCQFAHRGHPLLGDIKYGSRIPLPGSRIALSACQVQFFHPVTKKEILIKL